jgi:hypothetical protein
MFAFIFLKRVLIMKISGFIFLVSVIFSSNTFACSPAPPPRYEISGVSVFYKNCCDDQSLSVSEDVRHFKVINAVYAQDSRHVYYMGKAIKDADPMSFTFLGGTSTLTYSDGYAKDAARVYFEGKIVAEADPASFVLFKNAPAFAKDKRHVYFRDRAMTQLNALTTKSLGNAYWLDGDTLYHFRYDYQKNKAVLIRLGHQFEGKYKHLNDYFVSNLGVFHGGEKTPYDPASFVMLATMDIGDTCVRNLVTPLVSDKHGTYLEGKKLAVRLQPLGAYSNLYESDRQTLYAYTRDGGLQLLGLKSRLRLIKGENATLILGSTKKYILDYYHLRDLSKTGALPVNSTLSIYAPLDSVVILTDGRQLYTFDSEIQLIPGGMHRLLYLDEDTAVFEGKDGEILNVERGSVIGNNPKHSNSYPYDAAGIKFIKYSKLLAELMKPKQKLEVGSGMFLTKKYITFSSGEPAVAINSAQYRELAAYAVSDAEWEEIRKRMVQKYQQDRH